MKKVKEKVIEAYRSGLKVSEIARQYNIHEKTIYRWLHQNNVTLKTDVPPPSEKLGYVIGFVVADGYVNRTATGMNIYVTNTNLKLLEKFINIAKEIGLNPHTPYISKRRTLGGKIEFKTHICHTKLARKIVDFDKTILNSNKEMKKGFLGGVFDGDGSLIITSFTHPTKGNCHSVELRFPSLNNRILNVIATILREFRIPFHFEKAKSGFTGEPIDRIAISGITNSIALLSSIPFFHTEKRNKFNELKKILDEMYPPSRRYVMGLISQRLEHLS